MNIREYLEKKPLLFDGAMGTYLGKCYPDYDRAECEWMNLTNPERVVAAHKEYLHAGARAIKTNTFAVNDAMSDMDEEKREEAVRAGVILAERAVREYESETEEAGDEHFIFADMGPVLMPEENVFHSYRKIAEIFLEQGMRNFLLETLEDGKGIAELAAYIKERAHDAFIIVSFGVSPEGFTGGGCFGRSLFRQIQQVEEVDAIGFNCISGPRHLQELVRRLDRRGCRKYLSVMPNAGYPTRVNNRTFYSNNQEYFAEVMHEIACEGAAIIGGCCGTEPSYIREIAQLLRKEPVSTAGTTAVKMTEQSTELSEAEGDARETAKRACDNPENDFAVKLSQGQRVIVVELDPPVMPEIDGFIEGAARYKRAGADAIDIADCPIARARIDSSLLACKVKRELNMTAIPHMTCRDRNMNATKALLLGLNVEGVNNVLTVTGDPVPVAQRQEVKTVFSYNSAVLAKHINTLNEMVFPENPFLVSGALNINARQFDSQLTHAMRKVENGVSVLFTQPVMTERGLENLKRARQELPVKLLAGLIPVVSYRNACFMQHEIAGIDVDERILALYRDKDREESEMLAERIVLEIAARTREYSDGFYLITPFQRIALIERILRKLRSL